MAEIAPPQSPLNRPIRLGVLLSGGGTTLVNLLASIEQGEVSAEIPIVIASRSCGGVERAREAGLAVEVISRQDFEDVAGFSHAVFERISQAKVDLVTLMGFLSLIEIPDAFRYRVMNIHPSLIPSFCGHGFFGHHVHEAVVARGVKVSGCTVHFADQEYDHGPIVVQRTVEVKAGETADDVARNVFAEECRAYPEAIRLYAEGRLRIENRAVRVLPGN